MPELPQTEIEPYQQDQGSAMSSRMCWPSANVELDVAVQGVLQTEQGKDHQVHYEDIRNDIAKTSSR
eukprot:12893460-Prorocentrum_lima.AAC.1